MAAFKWHPSEDPPPIEAHSKAKLNVLRRYLRAYFDRLNVNPQRETFKLDLVDGFAGGGSIFGRRCHSAWHAGDHAGRGEGSRKLG